MDIRDIIAGDWKLEIDRGLRRAEYFVASFPLGRTDRARWNEETAFGDGALRPRSARDGRDIPGRNWNDGTGTTELDDDGSGSRQ